jgi:DNA topoisomerase-1
LQSGKVGEKLLKENTGSDKGKLVPTDIGTIVDFLVKNGNILDYILQQK